MYGLIHKLKKRKVKLKTIFKSNNHKNKRLAYSIWFCPVLLLSFEKCACCNPSESTAQFWCLFWPFPYFDINNNSGGKRDVKLSQRGSVCHGNLPLGYARSSYDLLSSLRYFISL